MAGIRGGAVIGVGLGLVLALAGCGTPKAPAPTVTVRALPTAAVVAERANPVPILNKIKGCVLEDGTEVGDHDINGNRFAGCYFMDNIATDANGKAEAGTMGTGVTARTYLGDPRTLEDPEMLKSDDGSKKIIGKDFVVTITGMWSNYSKHLGPKEIEEIAHQVGGDYIPSQ